jgi:hypothetical protein
MQGQLKLAPFVTVFLLLEEKKTIQDSEFGTIIADHIVIQ